MQSKKYQDFVVLQQNAVVNFPFGFSEEIPGGEFFLWEYNSTCSMRSQNSVSAEQD